MKLCRTCNTEKESKDFHKRKASKDGLAARCKSCQKKYDDARLRDPKRMEMRRQYQKTEKGREAHNRATKKWIEKNTIKRAVHILTGNAIRDGILIKKRCEVCQAKKVHAHHDDYAKPLEVRWLCDKHHNDWHNENGEGKNAH